MAKGKKTGGRTKGTKNRHTFHAEELAQQFEMEPLQFLLCVLNNDWEQLGFDGPTRTSFTNAGIEFEEDRIRMEQRVAAAKEACRYLYSSKQAVTLKNEEGQGFKIVLEDYSNKK